MAACQSRAKQAMRLKSGIWVAAYVRRCDINGAFAAVRRRGAEEAGAVFIKISRLDGTAILFGPAPQAVFDEAQPADRRFFRVLGRRASRRSRYRGAPDARDPLRPGFVDRRGRGQGRAEFPRRRREITRYRSLLLIVPAVRRARRVAGSAWLSGARRGARRSSRQVHRLVSGLVSRHAAAPLSRARS